ncbi:ABC-type antimicrobial peptide transport system permease subunit [Niveibacterium umoris]|uniref:ABC-type antimicrobial peptide transport system permease subunit n=2 Tax=Niveibacterium umoris TaxID=1193620 RepID=A0A840BG56_9RHOO|nr:ABC-type antimicrobial peptide transport system permease subunit [Niveibacterium umoris]
MALVVFVFAAVRMLDAGLKQTLVATGTPENVVVIRKGAETEVQSGVTRDQAGQVESLPQIARGPGGAAMVSKETVVLYALPKKGSDKPTNVVIRGVGEFGMTLRSQVRLSAGRMFAPGSAEVIVGAGVAEKFRGAGLGQSLRFGGRDWIIVGVFDAGKTAFESEIWGDAEQLIPAFRRTAFSSLLVRLNSRDDFAAVRDAIDSDPRLGLEAKTEQRFYADQSEALSKFITILGMTLSIIFSIGAVIGAMITMYSAVATRTAEIGTLRALGFRRAKILTAFLAESLFLALLGGVMGLAMASGMQWVSISTTNFQTFAELAFSFTLTPRIVVETLVFSLVMGLVGGFLPAVRAARLDIVTALREG